MSKPDDIPQDVWAAASAINDILLPSGVAKIARLVMAERERCAKIADAHAAENWGMTEEEHVAQVIAEAIRKGTP